MRTLHSLIAFVALFWALTASAQTRSDVTVGSTYDIISSIDLRDGPGQKYDKKINQKASDYLRRIEYLSVDESTTVKVIDVKDGWAEIQVVEPAVLADTHQGWIPLTALKHGKATHKRNGWITHTCFVYSATDTKSKRIGYLQQRSAVDIVDNGSAWLEVSSWGPNPVMDLKTKQLLDDAQMEGPMYIEGVNFTETPPGRW